MPHRIKILTALLAALAAGSLSAAPEFINSAQKLATAGQFYSDADNFISPSSYADLDFENFFGVVSFDQSLMAQLGAAFRFGNTYMGLYYGGNAWKIQNSDYEERKDSYFGSSRIIRSYKALPAINQFDSLNEAAVLLGVEDTVGVRLAYLHTYQSQRITENFRVGAPPGASYYKSYLDENGHINPELAVAMARDLIPDRGIRPQLYLDFDIFRDYQRLEQYTTSKATGGEKVNRSNNYLGIGATLAMGYVSFVNVNDFDFGADFWYTLGVTAYNNEYPYQKKGKWQRANLKGVFDGDALTEQSGSSHSIAPYLYASWSGEKVSLCSELGLEMDIAVDSSAELAQPDIAKTKLVKQGALDKTTVFTFIPVLNLGMQWEVVPEKFFINVGGGISFGGPTLSKTLSQNYANNKTSGSATTAVENTFAGAETTLSVGVGLNPIENLGLQAVCGVDIDNSVKLFDPEVGKGLGTFFKLLATVSF